jgi:hypothetical protein
VRWRLLLGLVLATGAGAGRAQTMLDQEQRLIEVHSLLVALPAVEAPGALRPGQASLGLEIVTIPIIDGTTGSKVQITASDQARAFPRPRLAIGLPSAGDFRFFVGLAYIPPFEFHRLSTHLLGAEGGAAWVGERVVVGLRGQVVYATSSSPVTDPATLDTLETFLYGGDLSVAVPFQAWPGTLTPYVGAGLLRVDGRFRVSSDGEVLTSHTTNPSLSAGLRLVAGRHLEAAVEVVAYPGRMVHPAFRIAWVHDFGG